MFGFSLKQLLRQPGKAVLFFLLMAASTALIVTGAIMSIENSNRIQIVEDTYSTVGYVEQLPTKIDTEVVVDPCYGVYTDSVPEYGEFLTSDIFDFPGAEYVQEPEYRPYYISSLPQLRHSDSWFYRRHILEFTPLEPGSGEDGPIEVIITKVLQSDVDPAHANYADSHTDRSLQVGDIIPICQHEASVVCPLTAGERYVSTVSLYGDCPEHGFEYQSYIAPYSHQYSREENSVITGDLQTERARGSVSQVTGEDFYEKGQPGYRYVQWAEQYRLEDSLFLTTATNSLNLLPSWHEEKAQVVSGRAITPDEFADGAAVCMVPDKLATPNQLDIGDKINLPLLCSVYKDMSVSLGRLPFDFSLLNADGEFYEPFWEQEYEIVGIYNAGRDSTHDLVDDMFIIPAKSVRASDSSNIAWYEPMCKNTASFQIPNGSITEFDTAFKHAVKEAESLDVSYDDRGYSEIIQSLEASRSIAFLLLAAGILAALAIIALLLYFFVVKERKRTAIERSLGMSKRQCRISILAGVMLLTVIAASLGSLGGVILLEKTQEAAAETESVEVNQYTYDTRYSMWAKGRELAENTEIEVETPTAVYFAVPAAVVLLVLAISWVLMARSFRIDPIYLLSTKDKG